MEYRKPSIFRPGALVFVSLRWGGGKLDGDVNFRNLAARADHQKMANFLTFSTKNDKNKLQRKK